MAKQVGIYQFNGKLGEAVGSKARKGYQVVKRAPVATKNPSTKAQVMQRTIFAACAASGAAVPEGAIVGLRPYAKAGGMSIRNAFAKLLQKTGAITATWIAAEQEANTVFNKEKVVYARGNQPNIIAGAPQFDTPEAVEFSYDMGELNPKTTNVIAVVWCGDLKQFVVKKFTDLQASGTLNIVCPSLWNGLSVSVYAYTQCFESADQKNALYEAEIFAAAGEIKVAESNAKYSNSAYIGHGTIG